MAISPVLLKGIVGIGALSTVAMGGTYLYMGTDLIVDNGKFSMKFKDIDDFALDPARTWTLTTTPANLSTASGSVNVEVILKTTDNTKTWACKIHGTIDSVQSDYSWDIKALETAIGITGNSAARAKNKQHNFKAFFEKCKKGRTPNSTKTSSMGIIGSIKITEEVHTKKYGFDESELRNLYEGTNELLQELNVDVRNTNTFPIEVNLTHEQFKKIKFEGKNNPSVPDNTSIKLKIEKSNDDTANSYPEELKFTFTNNENIKIKQDDQENNQIVLAANSNTEFKIKITQEGVYSLEKIWNEETLGAKVGLNCQHSGDQNSCSFGNKINVYKDGNNKLEDASIQEGDTKKITFTKNEKGYNQGFKWKVSEEITLNSGTGSSNSISKDKSYEIVYKGVSGIEKWYLVEKDQQ